MANSFLINMVRGTFGVILPGTAVDNASKVGLQIAAAGGLLIPATNATVAAGAVQAQALAAQAGDPKEMGEIMNAALDKAQDGAETATFDNGVEVDTIDELTSGSGVDVDGMLIKDSTIGPGQSITILDTIPLPLHGARVVSAGGDVGNIAAIGGVLASDTSPILRADAAESEELSWATGDAEPIQWQVPLPDGFLPTKDVTVKLRVWSGTTDAVTTSIETSWGGGAKVTDSADDAATKSATVHEITATILAADIAAGAEYLTIMLIIGAHATDIAQIVSAKLIISRTLTTAAA